MISCFLQTEIFPDLDLTDIIQEFGQQLTPEGNEKSG